MADEKASPMPSAATGNYAALKEVWDEQCSQIADMCSYARAPEDAAPDAWTLRDALVRLRGERDAAVAEVYRLIHGRPRSAIDTALASIEAMYPAADGPCADQETRPYVFDVTLYTRPADRSERWERRVRLHSTARHAAVEAFWSALTVVGFAIEPMPAPPASDEATNHDDADCCGFCGRLFPLFPKGDGGSIHCNCDDTFRAEGFDDNYRCKEPSHRDVKPENIAPAAPSSGETLPRACIDAGECQRKAIIKACAEDAATMIRLRRVADAARDFYEMHADAHGAETKIHNPIWIALRAALDALPKVTT